MKQLKWMSLVLGLMLTASVAGAAPASSPEPAGTAVQAGKRSNVSPLRNVVVNTVPAQPYRRLYVQINFDRDYAAIGLALADSLNKMLTSRGKTVASELQLVDELSLAPGPNTKAALKFAPQVTVLCRILESRIVISRRSYGASYDYGCELLEGAAGKRIWSAQGSFGSNEATKKTMDEVAAQIIRQLYSLHII